MTNWTEKSAAFRKHLALKTEPVAFKRLEKAAALDEIKGLTRMEKTHTFCQLPFMVRTMGMTLGITSDSKILDRCKRLHALRPTTEEAQQQEANMLSKTWFASPEEAMIQQRDYPLMPAGEAVVLAPLARTAFEPDVISIFGNPAQIMLIMCGLQKVRYEKFHFTFIGEGACTDSIAQCFTSGKPSLAIPCYGERTLGQVTDEEIVLALPPGEIDRALEGLARLKKVGFIYPPVFIGGIANPLSALANFYPEAERSK
jgi:uncharacterized protein (DUF169 family)